MGESLWWNDFATRRYLAMFGDIFGCHNLSQGRRDSTGIQWLEARDTAKRLTEHGTASHNKELPSPKYE